MTANRLTRCWFIAMLLLYPPSAWAHGPGLFINILGGISIFAIVPIAVLLFLGIKTINKPNPAWPIALLTISAGFIFVCTTLALTLSDFGPSALWAVLIYISLTLGNIVWIAYVVVRRRQK
ncbi:MAG: hypothetical protein JXX29_19255 [Deltaproteobacteria bacterium]|nr:hypothetical protein [Deltaproteobacteria bacterium]MBN2673826.1 hypothetical protein [Deltaproteobacteria bacterium]